MGSWGACNAAWVSNQPVTSLDECRVGKGNGIMIFDSKATTLPEALKDAALDIARLDYGGAKWIQDKQVIADSFDRKHLTDLVGTLCDPHNGVVWVVSQEVGGKWHYWRIN